jgi:hypothetical protein
MKNTKRISFDHNHACHLYELALEHFVDGCSECRNLKERLEKFMGKKDVRYYKKVVKENGYCKAVIKEKLEDNPYKLTDKDLACLEELCKDDKRDEEGRKSVLKIIEDQLKKETSLDKKTRLKLMKEIEALED